MTKVLIATCIAGRSWLYSPYFDSAGPSFLKNQANGCKLQLTRCVKSDASQKGVSYSACASIVSVPARFWKHQNCGRFAIPADWWIFHNFPWKISLWATSRWLRVWLVRSDFHWQGGVLPPLRPRILRNWTRAEQKRSCLDSPLLHIVSTFGTEFLTGCRIFYVKMNPNVIEVGIVAGRMSLTETHKGRTISNELLVTSLTSM